jgi:hypothetical protein
MSIYSKPEMGLLGQILTTEVDPVEIEKCSLCELSKIIKQKAMSAMLIADLDPNLSVEIDGEKWDRSRSMQGLRDLYDWADSICEREQGGAAAIVTTGNPCHPPRGC